ncbi:MAG: cellulase family glycosylhydrolase [Lentisphaerae bacterium]|jgi:aryl-phospho-beta-D-glucosidase BglC (GH1 family)|nr:cellulase family glycosylhydrolase [Lentisphaerota bacterium]MBT4815884.1 cellulase family glycosylhydrolase [Lentisphaerota bacterium]MBT5610426.1 cellulase family glycosylhydrolase [Lentisphaerota bacterium]MBT7061680.1 cellulase family glycosylhydrolase [Lentisphaerota bacterium]
MTLAGISAVRISTGILIVSGALSGHAQEPAGKQEWLPASPAKLPCWRGFNLLEKFHLSRGKKPFLESDFRMMSELGFNFVRLPMDYRTWIRDGDWTTFDEEALREIDQAVEWGEQYGIHVMINFHRAPGYCVNKRPPEPASVWEDAETQRVCALHWATFAKRYRGIPNERVSFNLFNEPNKVEAETYLGVVEMLTDAIRAEDPDRLIISDSFFGDSSALGKGLKRLNVAFSPHQYWPGRVTHYKASWVKGSDQYPVPTWPMMSCSGRLFSPTKKGYPPGPLTLSGPFTRTTQLRLKMGRVSARALVVIRADDREIWRKDFVPGPGEGEWEKVVFAEQWNIHQNIYNRDYTCEIPAGAEVVTVAMEAGDWCVLSEAGLTRPGQTEDVLPLSNEWNVRAGVATYTPGGPRGAFAGQKTIGADAIRDHMTSWRGVKAHGVGVFIGECGVFNKTPHDVSLRWLEDSMRLLKEQGWGWALWNFRGSFGILDSGREDVEYESYQGHKLDRKMLDILLRY